MPKIVETISSLSNTIKDTSTIMRNPSLHNSDKGVTHDCASILDSIAKGTYCFHYFSHGASLHRHSFSRMIFTLVYNCMGERSEPALLSCLQCLDYEWLAALRAGAH